MSRDEAIDMFPELRPTFMAPRDVTVEFEPPAVCPCCLTEIMGYDDEVCPVCGHVDRTGAWL